MDFYRPRKPNGVLQYMWWKHVPAWEHRGKEPNMQKITAVKTGIHGPAAFPWQAGFPWMSLFRSVGLFWLTLVGVPCRTPMPEPFQAGKELEGNWHNSQGQLGLPALGHQQTQKNNITFSWLFMATVSSQNAKMSTSWSGRRGSQILRLLASYPKNSVLSAGPP